MDKFYTQPLFLQWFLTLLLLIVGFYPALIIIEQTYEQPFFAFFFIIYVPIAQFSFTPFFRLIGVYTYYSPMLLGYMANDVQIDLHSGGSFDYLLVMRKYKSGVRMRKQLMIFHLEGLLTLVQGIEQGTIPESVSIIGTSYFFNERTIKKMGFETEAPTLFYRLNLFVNFIDLFWMYSLSKGKLAIPSVWKARKISISGSNLNNNKEFIASLHKKMNTLNSAHQSSVQ